MGQDLKPRAPAPCEHFICLYESDCIKNIVADAHDVDHAGSRVTFARICERYDGITLARVKLYISNCNACRLDAPPVEIPSVTPILASYLREWLIFDAVNMSRYAIVNDGICYLYNFIDSFTKFAWSYPAKDKSASTFNQILNKHFLSEGKFDIFHSDNGSEFRNEQVEATLGKMRNF